MRVLARTHVVSRIFVWMLTCCGSAGLHPSWVTSGRRAQSVATFDPCSCLAVSCVARQCYKAACVWLLPTLSSMSTQGCEALHPVGQLNFAYSPVVLKHPCLLCSLLSPAEHTRPLSSSSTASARSTLWSKRWHSGSLHQLRALAVQLRRLSSHA